MICSRLRECVSDSLCVYFFIPIRKKKQKRFAVISNIQQQKNQSQFALNLSLLPSSILLFSPRRPESYGHTPELIHYISDMRSGRISKRWLAHCKPWQDT